MRGLIWCATTVVYKVIYKELMENYCTMYSATGRYHYNNYIYSNVINELCGKSQIWITKMTNLIKITKAISGYCERSETACPNHVMPGKNIALWSDI
jgi:hypothetical protein